MREIKFRAWDKQMKNMFAPAWITAVGEVADFLDADEKHRAKGLYSSTRPTRLNDIVLMQSTGLTDKNGKEVYDGDVVRFTKPSPSMKPRKAGRPTFNDMVVVWGSDTRKSSWHLLWRGVDGNKYAGLEKMLKTDTHEVIGNIYENPELLK